MKRSTIVIIGIILVIGLLVFGGVGSYNKLVAQREKVDTALSEIDNQLQRRNDLIPNLVSTVKRYAAQEEEIFTQIADARAQLAGANTIADQAQGDAAMTSALNRLLVVVENYPELKSNENFINLQDELAGTENRLTVTRKDYNDIAREYNTKIKQFPTSIFAGILGFEDVEYFTAEEGAQENPNVGDLFEE